MRILLKDENGALKDHESRRYAMHSLRQIPQSKPALQADGEETVADDEKYQVSSDFASIWKSVTELGKPRQQTGPNSPC